MNKSEVDLFTMDALKTISALLIFTVTIHTNAYHLLTFSNM
jgi:hypothetical protein